jgi:hypothetical protein
MGKQLAGMDNGYYRSNGVECCYCEINTGMTNYLNIVISHDFHRSGSCSCGGVRNEKYRKGSYVLYIRPTRGVFMMKKKNSKEIELTNIVYLEEKLNEYFKEVVPAQV